MAAAAAAASPQRLSLPSLARPSLALARLGRSICATVLWRRLIIANGKRAADRWLPVCAAPQLCRRRRRRQADRKLAAHPSPPSVKDPLRPLDGQFSPGSSDYFARLQLAGTTRTHLLAGCCSLSRRRARCSLPTAHRSPLTARSSKLTTQGSRLEARNSQLATGRRASTWRTFARSSASSFCRF